MNDLIDIRTPLAASKNARVELGQDGALRPPALALVSNEDADKAEASAKVRALPVRLR
jgi:hypothetical protein